MIDPQMASIPLEARDTALTIIHTAIGVMAKCATGKIGAEVWPAELSERVRATVGDWSRTGCPVDPIVVALGQLTRVMVDVFAARHGESATASSRLRELTLASRRLLRELFDGVKSGAAQEERDDDGVRRAVLTAAREKNSRSPSYVVSALRPDDARGLARIRAFVKSGSDLGAVFTSTPTGHVVLIPCADSANAMPTAQEFWKRLGGQYWMGCCWRTVADLPSGRREASDLAALAVATGQRPGVFDVKSVALEYTALMNPEVSHSVLKALAPLLSDDLLLETVLAVLDSQGSRKRAARQLLIHRSTVNRRLEKIAELTGHDPSSQRGFMTFTLAMAARSLLRAGLLPGHSSQPRLALV
ncbi:CdaR family transcriptional regulator [Lentzea sp. HUAS12]|uniref:PucR family transcriptional regulator n=1 Tax=Lentzea sp. HUAS12 TaxID=2951806 RepID=UPI00209DFA45|nr:PucR family transcriptional regulator [Lentzea sp. HUAS12]USX56271.1 helix-turn-helix domain-containing protein [Lentzea sp. HUAS12]